MPGLGEVALGGHPTGTGLGAVVSVESSHWIQVAKPSPGSVWEPHELSRPDSPFLLHRTPSPPTTRSHGAGPAARTHRGAAEGSWAAGEYRGSGAAGADGDGPQSRTALRPCPWGGRGCAGAAPAPSCTGSSLPRTVPSNSSAAPGVEEAHPMSPWRSCYPRAGWEDPQGAGQCGTPRCWELRPQSTT